MERSSHQDDRLWDEALDLVIRLQNDPRNAVTHDMIQRWRRRSPAHAAAWSEASEIHGLSGRVLSGRREAEQSRGRRDVSRRLMLLGGGAAAAVIGGLVGPPLLLRARADHMTEAGETRRIALADGSAATLGPGSALRLGFSALARNVELLAGMAFFEVSPDASRPFRVMTEKLVATALGTAFEVGNDAGYLTVTVDHGLVGVDLGAAAGTSRATQLGPGEWLTFDASLRTLERGSKEKAQIAAWRDGWIFADGETVSALVARISRWRQGKVLVADSSFGGERVSGAFDLADPQAALEAVVSPFGGVVRMLSPYLTVISRF